MKKAGLHHFRHLVLVLGDQLDPKSAAFDGFDRATDAVWMAEVSRESKKVWSHKARIAFFLSAMRHFRDELQKSGCLVDYTLLDDPDNVESFGAELSKAIASAKPKKLIIVEPGEWSVREEIERAAKNGGVPLEVRPDRHFLCTREEFEKHAGSRKQLRMEFFYREMRTRRGVLMDPDGNPIGGQWNFDADNRESFGKEGPAEVPAPRSFLPDRTTREVIDLVERRFAAHPGSLKNFDWPVTAKDAEDALADFIASRLPYFGRWEDAMWSEQPWLWHSRLSAAMNLKLLNPRDAIAAAENAFRKGKAPLAGVEGFIRQVLGWREYVRGIYWKLMPEYLECNALGAEQALPAFYWTGDTDMNCLRQVIGQTLVFGYAHHIQRLMVTGLYALLLGVRPREVHEWYLAVYVDAIEWVELPNTLGMSQYADGGVMASKPYIASGKYIQRMSNYCAGCRFDPAQSTGPRACPFTTLYWDFLLRHEKSLSKNQRMKMQLRNLKRLDAEKKTLICKKAAGLRDTVAKRK